MNTIESQNAQIIGEYFIRTCKTHNVYEVFKKRFQPNNKILKYVTPSDGNCNNVAQMFDSVNKNVSQHKKVRNDKYESITLTINTLLQYYLEGGGVNPQNLGQIGQEIFNLSCYRIFGQAFIEDMKKEQESHGGHIPSNDFEHFAYSQYMHLYHDGHIHCSFEDFLSTYGNTLKSHWKELRGNMKRKMPF